VSPDRSTFRSIEQSFTDREIAFLYNSIVFPFLRPVSRAVDDPLEEIYVHFKAALAAKAAPETRSVLREGQSREENDPIRPLR
jgi:hypothetical protein